MAIEVSSDRVICTKCGTQYSRRRSFFAVSYAELHKGLGYVHICKKCTDELYAKYLAQSGGDSKLAVRQVCRKLDLYWNENIYNSVINKSTNRTIITQYMSRLNSVSMAGKSYDDTLLAEGTLWKFSAPPSVMQSVNPTPASLNQLNPIEITDEIRAFWGPGYSASMYGELEQRRAYYMSKLPPGSSVDIGSEALLRQICNLEVCIAKDQAAGKSIDKSVNALNTLIGSMNLKPAQQKEDIDASLEKTPFGVWIKKWEDKRPIAEPDPELQDVDGVIRYISIWFLGHLSKMLGMKNAYCKLYEDELARMRVDMPEYIDEDDETMFNEVFSINNEEDTEEYTI